MHRKRKERKRCLPTDQKSVAAVLDRELLEDAARRQGPPDALTSSLLRPLSLLEKRRVQEEEGKVIFWLAFVNQNVHLTTHRHLRTIIVPKRLSSSERRPMNCEQPSSIAGQARQNDRGDEQSSLAATRSNYGSEQVSILVCPLDPVQSSVPKPP
jgi:hypothetical protein